MANVVDSEIWRERLHNEELAFSMSSSQRVRYMARDAFRTHYNASNLSAVGRAVAPMGYHPLTPQGPFATGSQFNTTRKPFGDPLLCARAQTANAAPKSDMLSSPRRPPSRLFKNSYETEFTRNFSPFSAMPVAYDHRYIPLAPLSSKTAAEE